MSEQTSDGVPLSDTERLRDLTRRLGFGDGITEPQADNDTIVRWVEDRVAEASEWVEATRWHDACHAAGHEDPITCEEHEPVAAARADEREWLHAHLLSDGLRRLMAQEYLIDRGDYHGQDLTRHANAMAAAVRAAFSQPGYPPVSPGADA